MAPGFKIPLPLILSARGRLRRWVFWVSFPSVAALFLALYLVLENVAGRGSTLILYPPFFWSAYALASKRYHDLGGSAAWLLLLLVPILGPLWVACELLFRRGTRGENRYGPDPRDSVDYYSVPTPHSKGPAVDDVTGLNSVAVAEVVAPTSVQEVVDALRRTAGPISVGGGRFSMGGQVASPGSLHLDMRKLNQVIQFSPLHRTIRVQAGIRWCDIQRAVDPHNLSVKIMQSYANFTVGGSLGVNSHGRYVGLGPLILSVRSIRVALANGDLMEASPTQNPQLFFGAIGGYGGLGVIVEAELDLEENARVERVATKVSVDDYLTHFREKILKTGGAIFHNADIYPPHYRRMRCVTWVATRKSVTQPHRLMPIRRSYPLHKYFLWAWSEHITGQWRREFLIEPLLYLRSTVHWRNYEAGYDVGEVAPVTTRRRTYALQEYFVPVERFPEFVPKMAEILRRYRVKAVNISVRHAAADAGSLLAWAKGETFAFVLYHKQGLSPDERARVGIWTRELIDAAIAAGGSFYLPYQVHATPDQFHRAYPRAREFFELKRKLDPRFRFRNAIWDAYYDLRVPAAGAPSDSEFKAVYSEAASRDRFFLFLQNIYHLYPEDRFHGLIQEACAKFSGDEEIYEHLRKEVPKIKPFLGDLYYAIPALQAQKRELVRQTLELLGGRTSIDGYVEIGSTGRYASLLRKHIGLRGPLIVVNDAPPTNSPTDILERGRFGKLGTYVPLNDYEPLSAAAIPDGSIDVVTCYIGLHHSPPGRLDAFVRSIWRVLRPGGLFIVRDHDATSAPMKAFVSLAHSVFNAGLGIDWETNRKELRHFDSVEAWCRFLAARGFVDTGRRLLQANDPTDNTLFAFQKEPGSGQGAVPQAKASPAPVRGRSESEVPRAGFWRRTIRFTGVTIALILASLGAGALQEPTPEPITPKEYRRGPDQTFLTFPEWYLVFSPEEYAAFIRNRPPSEFPYFGHLDQFWTSYGKIREAIRPFPPNSEYQMMVMVIGTSTTAEYSFKAGYETLIGRLSELTRGENLTAEDALAARVAQDYVEFLRVQPWYEYDFMGKLKELWGGTGFWGSDMIRKWERKYFLTTEYGVKALYGWIIKKATRASFEVPKPETAAVVRSLSLEARGRIPDLKVLREFPDGSTLITLPRYEAFTKCALAAARNGVDFEEIAGNRGDILVTILLPMSSTAWAPGMDPVWRPLFHQQILTEPTRERVALVVPIRSLGPLLRSLNSPEIRIEHVFDF